MDDDFDFFEESFNESSAAKIAAVPVGHCLGMYSFCGLQRL